MEDRRLMECAYYVCVTSILFTWHVCCNIDSRDATENGR